MSCHGAFDGMRPVAVRPGREEQAAAEIGQEREHQRRAHQRHLLPKPVEEHGGKERAGKQAAGERANAEACVLHAHVPLRQREDIPLLLDRQSKHIEDKRDHRHHPAQEREIQLRSIADTIGAETSQTSTGNTNNAVSCTRASARHPAARGAGESGAFTKRSGSRMPAAPSVIARVPGCDVPAPAR